MSDRNLNLKVVFSGAGNLGAMMRVMTGSAGGAQAALRKLNQEARSQKQALNLVKDSLRTASGNVTQLMNAERKLEAQVAATTKKITAQKAALSRQARAAALGGNLRAAGSGNLIRGGATAAGLFVVGKQAADFQDGMTDIQQKADMSAAATARLQSNIVAAAKAAHQLPENMRAGVDNLIGAGLDPGRAIAMMAPIGKTATAYRADIAELSATAFAAYDNLKVPINQTAQALDAMAMAGKMGNFEMKDMATVFPALTASAQALGQQGAPAVADLAAAVQIARKGAGNAETAAANVQNLLAKINTADTIANFRKFGIDLPAAMKKAYAEGKTPLEAIAELANKATGGNSENLSFLFGDMQAQQALRPLIANMAEYRRIRDAAMKATGTVDKDFALRSQNASVQATALTGNLQAIAVQLGSALLPGLVQASQSVLKLTAGFAAFAEKHPGLVAFLVKSAVLFAASSLAIGGVQSAIGTVVGPIMKLYNGFVWLSKLGPVVGMMARAGPMMATAFGIMRTAAMFLARGLMQAGMMMLANPIILIITAVVVAVGIAGYLIYKNWDKIKAAFAIGLKFMQGLWSQFKTIGGQIMQGLIGGIAAKIDAIKTMITGVAGKVIGWFKGVLGIHSPSRVFMGFGGHISSGLALGIQRSMHKPMRTARAMAAGVAGAMTIGSAFPAMAGPSAARSQTPVIIQIAPGAIVVNAAPGQSAQDIGLAVEAALMRHAQQAAAAKRSRFQDDDA